MKTVRAFAALLLLLPAMALAAEVRVDSETIVRWFERDDRSGDEQTVLPLYEYLRVEVGELTEKGLSFHAYGWGRHDFGDGDDYYRDDSEGEILYGYLEYTHEAHNIGAWAGRQHVFAGVANETVDGLGARGDLGQYFGLSVYTGLPVAVEESEGRDGDWIWGGRLSHRLGRWYEVGVSYKRVDDDSDKQEEVVGIDGSAHVGVVSLHGLSARNLETDSWQEHSYEARVWLGGFVLRPFFERYDYEGLFGTGTNSGSALRFLVDSEETVTSFGADLTWSPTTRVELELKGKRYDYDERDDEAWYYGALVTLHMEDLSQVGAEVGVMDGDTDDTRYSLYRGFLYWDLAPAYVSADVVYVDYDEDVGPAPLDDDQSFFASLGAGHWFFDERLELRLSGDYSADPYFDDDWRGMLALRYRFDK